MSFCFIIESIHVVRTQKKITFGKLHRQILILV
jgi:hypothetical protein